VRETGGGIHNALEGQHGIDGMLAPMPLAALL
jgi:hypothetical protein